MLLQEQSEHQDQEISELIIKKKTRKTRKQEHKEKLKRRKRVEEFSKDVENDKTSAEYALKNMKPEIEGALFQLMLLKDEELLRFLSG